MYGIAMMGFLSALGAFILVWKINLYLFCKYHWQTDLLFAVVVTWLFFGTFSGMATAAVAGVTFSVLLYMAKLITDI
jgi:hypothetical protein